MSKTKQPRPNVAADLTFHLAQAGMSKADLSRALKVTPSAVTKMFKADHNWTLDTLIAAFDAMGCFMRIEVARYSDFTPPALEEVKGAEHHG